MSRHVFPAAFPRTMKRSYTPQKKQTGTSSNARPGQEVSPPFWDALNRTTVEDKLVSLTEIHESDLRNEWVEQIDEKTKEEEWKEWEENGLKIVVNRYYRTSEGSTGEGATLVFSHANGFSKETWEPTIAHLLDTNASSGSDVQEIWALDEIQSGDSAVINYGKLGDAFTWLDGGRDLLQFLLLYLPPLSAHSQPQKLPFVLPPQLQDDVSSYLLLDKSPLSPISQKLFSSTAPKPERLSVGLGNGSNGRWRRRRIVGIGHSLGGCSTSVAATTFPSLFSLLILIDPIVQGPSIDRTAAVRFLAAGALRRRDVWPDRKAAKDNFLQKEFFRRWDERGLESYLQFSLVDLEFLEEAATPSKIGSRKEKDSDLDLNADAPAKGEEMSMSVPKGAEDAVAGSSDGKKSKANRVGKGGVTLKCRKEYEAIIFRDPKNSQAAFRRLWTITPTLPVHYIFPEYGQSALPEAGLEDLQQAVPHCAVNRVDGASHLIPMEMPNETATGIVNAMRRCFSNEGKNKARL